MHPSTGAPERLQRNEQKPSVSAGYAQRNPSCPSRIANRWVALRTMLPVQLGQSFPIEVYAMAGAQGCDRHSFLEHQRMLDIAVEAETVGLEIGTIWAGREQMDGDIVRSMARDRKIERFGQTRDLHERGYAA